MACVTIIIWLCNDCTIATGSELATEYTGRPEELPAPLSALTHDEDALQGTEHQERTTRRCAGCGHTSFDLFTLFEATE